MSSGKNYKEQPFALMHHAVLLGDDVRLAAYEKAIERMVEPGVCVVDVGAGTGILAGMAALRKAARVYAIEYFSETAELALAIAKKKKSGTGQCYGGERTLLQPSHSGCAGASDNGNHRSPWSGGKYS